MTRKTLSIFLIIVLLGSFLRTWKLDQYPVSVFGDELDLGYQAYSILETGKDYTGNSYPVLFHSFSEYRLPFNIYFTVPFEAILGLNEWGVRIPFVVYGIISIIALFFIARKLFNDKVALFATFLMSISPMSLHFSRQANDAGGALALTLLGTWLFLKGLSSYKMLVLSGGIYALSIYAYSITTIFTPLIVLALFLIYRKNILKYGLPKITLAISVGILVLTPYIYTFFQGSAGERFNKINLSSEKSIQEEIIRRRVESTSPITPLFQNTPVAVILEVTRNYLKSFSTQFLFINGDPNLRHSVGGIGEFYLFEFFTIIAGVFLIIRNYIHNSFKLTSNYVLVIVWLFISPIMSALTYGGGEHAPRQILMLPPMIIISALGLSLLLNIKKIAPFKILFFSLMFFSISLYFYRYYVEWPRDSFRAWHGGFKEAFVYAGSVDSQYSKVYINNTYEPSLNRFLFWYKYDPALFQSQFKGDKHVDDIDKSFDGFKIGDKYYFGAFKKPMEQFADPNTLVIASAREDISDPNIFNQGNMRLLKTVYTPNKEPVFYIFTGANK